MSEKELFLQLWEREAPTTRRVIAAFPPDKGDFKPHDRSNSAKTLAWLMISEERAFVQGALRGKIDFSDVGQPPETWEEMLAAGDKIHAEMVAKLKGASDADLEGTVPFMVGPKQPGDLPKMQILWLMLHDQIHHRGQFSVYIRLAGGKVPSIYGPSADEPWQ